MIKFINFLFLFLLLNACSNIENNSGVASSSSTNTPLSNHANQEQQPSDSSLANSEKIAADEQSVKNTAKIESKKEEQPKTTKSKEKKEDKKESADVTTIKQYFIDNYPSKKPLNADVSVEFLPNAKGENSLGIYKIVHSESGKNNTYFAKLSGDLYESDSYKRNSNTVNKFNELSQKGNYPYFVKYKESFTIPKALIKEQFKGLKEKALNESLGDIAVLVLEAAAGEDLDDFVKKAYETYSIDELKETFLKIGETIGNLHSYESTIKVIDNKNHISGFMHGDLTFGNIFYDVASKKVSLIDYVGLQKFDKIESQASDFFRSGAAISLKPLIDACKSKDEALKIKTIFESLQEGFEKAFESSSQKLAIIKFYVRVAGVLPYMKEFLEKYFKDELPNLELIKEEYNKAIKP